LTKDHIADGSVVFASRHLVSTIELMLLRITLVHNPNGKSIGSAVSAQLMTESLYTLQWATLSLQNCPSSWRIWTPSNSWFLGPFRDHKQMASQSILRFSHSWLQSVPIFYHGRPFRPKLLLPIGASGPHLTHDSLGPSEPTTQTASWLVQPFLHGYLVWQTDRQTDQPTDHATQSATIDRIYVRSTGDAVK